MRAMKWIVSRSGRGDSDGDQRPAKAAEMKTHFTEIALGQIPKHRPAVQAELLSAGEGQVKNHTSLYGFPAGLF